MTAGAAVRARSRRGRLIVSVHDVAPATATASARWLAELDARGIPATLLVVPGPWRGARLGEDPELVSALHAAQARGHEVAMHGWTHAGLPGGAAWRRAVGAVLARGCAEFAALEEAGAAARLRLGLAALEREGFTPVGFTPPGWLASPGTMRALADAGFAYTTGHLRVHDLRGGGSVTAPALSHRPGGAGERAGAALMVAGARKLARAGRTFRIALHPDDLGRPGLREATLRAVDGALALGAWPVTYAELLGAPDRPRADRSRADRSQAEGSQARRSGMPR